MSFNNPKGKKEAMSEVSRFAKENLDWVVSGIVVFVSIIATVISATWILSNSINDKLVSMEKRIDQRMTSIERDLTVIKTVLTMKNILPNDLTVEREDAGVAQW